MRGGLKARDVHAITASWAQDETFIRIRDVCGDRAIAKAGTDTQDRIRTGARPALRRTQDPPLYAAGRLEPETAQKIDPPGNIAQDRGNAGEKARFGRADHGKRRPDMPDEFAQSPQR